MREERLLERIRNTEKDPDRRGASDPALAVASVMSHLRKILNTRQGSVPIAEDYGVPDFTDLASSFGLDSVRDIEQALNEVVQKYEPRLKSVKVSFVPQEKDILSVQFKLEAKVVLENRELPVVFETVLESDGRISVKQ